MTRHRAWGAALVAVAAALLLAPSGSAANEGNASVTVDRELISTKLGGKFAFQSTITNNGSAEERGLIAHLNVLSLTNGTYVDPEDWSTSRTRYLDPIAPGDSVTMTWRMQAVNDGQFGIYVAVLPETGAPRPPAISPTIRLDVAGRKTLNAGGIVPLVLGIPAALGLMALGLRIRRHG